MIRYLRSNEGWVFIVGGRLDGNTRKIYFRIGTWRLFGTKLWVRGLSRAS